jgi:hypothetical protein
MIDIGTEELIALADAPSSPFLPRRGGRKIHVATVRRWASKGLRGHKLETVRCGAGLYTSGPALARFYERLTDSSGRDEPPVIRTPTARARAISQADAELARLGV